MPRYEYECQVCKFRHEAVRRIEDRRRGPICCGSPAEQRIFHSAPATYRQMEPYKCPATGQVVTSSAQRKRILKEHNLADAREFPAPNWEEMKEKRVEMHESANAPVPQDLDRAIKREGLDSIL